MNALARILVLAASALLTALVAGSFALQAAMWASPPPEVARVRPAEEFLVDSFANPVWLLIVCGSAAVGYYVSLSCLWNVKLTRAVPLVATSVVAVSAAVATFSLLLSPIAGLAAGLAAMLWSRGRAGWRLTGAG